MFPITDTLLRDRRFRRRLNEPVRVIAIFASLFRLSSLAEMIEVDYTSAAECTLKIGNPHFCESDTILIMKIVQRIDCDFIPGIFIIRIILNMCSIMRPRVIQHG